MKPFFDDGQVTIYRGDCREVLPTIPPASVDVILTDPPYGLSRIGGSIHRSQSKGTINLDFFDCDHDGEAFLLDVLLPACRLTLPLMVERGASYWWCSHRQFGPLEAVLAKRWEHTGFLVWRRLYAAPQVRKVSWRSVAELCVWGGRPKRFVSQQHMRNVIEYLPMINGTTKTGHPTEKPLGLMTHILHAAATVGDLVVDPFMGSGTTLLAAKLLGMRTIGIEREEKWCEVAAQRLSQGVLPLETAP